MSAKHDGVQEFAHRRRRAAKQVEMLSEELADLGQEFAELGAMLETEPERVVFYNPRSSRQSDTNKRAFSPKLVDTGYVSTKVDEFHRARAELKSLNDTLGL